MIKPTDKNEDGLSEFDQELLETRLISVLCNRHPFVGHHAVETAQGNVSQVFLQAIATRESWEAAGVVGGSS
jgi:hypothetical protein